MVTIHRPRTARLEQYLREQVARLLGALPSAIEQDRPITDFGLDSLIAAELTGVLERDLDVRIAGNKAFERHQYGARWRRRFTDCWGSMLSPKPARR